ILRSQLIKNRSVPFVKPEIPASQDNTLSFEKQYFRGVYESKRDQKIRKNGSRRRWRDSSRQQSNYANRDFERSVSRVEAPKAKQAEAARKREQDIAAGRVEMNGRELFLHQPWVIQTRSMGDRSVTQLCFFLMFHYL
ncbi:hypothetical protein HID58_035036, partial [Brassica napus]